MVFLTNFGIVRGQIMNQEEIFSKTIDTFLNPNSYIANSMNMYKKIDDNDTFDVENILFLKNVTLMQGPSTHTFKTFTLFTDSIIGFSVGE